MLVSVDEVKTHLRIDQDEEDVYLESLIRQAQAAAEPIAVIGDGEAVLQTGDTPVLGEGAHGLHLRTGQKSLGAGIEVQMLVSGEFHEAATSFLSYCMHL